MSKFIANRSPGSRSRPGGPPVEESIQPARAAIPLLLLVLRDAGAAEALARRLELLDARRVRVELDEALQSGELVLRVAGTLRSEVDEVLRVRAVAGLRVLRGLL